jgi:hypothetical protein
MGNLFRSIGREMALSVKRERVFTARYPQTIVYPSRSGNRFGVTKKGLLKAYQLTDQQKASSQKPYFVDLFDPREMAAEDADKLIELDAEIAKLQAKRQRLLKRSFARAKPVPVEVGLKITKERNDWRPI